MIRNFHNEIKMHYKDYPIGGKLMQATVIIPEEDIRNMSEDQKQTVREMLVTKMVQEIFRLKMVTITQLPLDPITFERRVSAFCYLAPDSTVQLLRTINKEK